MNDTAMKLMALADEWADQCGGCDSEHLAAHSAHRQALEAELVKLSDEIERLREDAARWQALASLVDECEASVVFYGRLDTINTGLEVTSAAELCDEIDNAKESE